MRPPQHPHYLSALTLSGVGHSVLFLLSQPINERSSFCRTALIDLQGKGVRTWYAPVEMKGGEKLYDQIDSAIRLHDKPLLVLSEHSLKSEWVLTEIRRCRKSEKREGKRKLFPIRLVDMETIGNWECFDADSGKDLAVTVREFFLPDFSNWKNQDAYKKAFDRQLRDLQKSAEQDLPSA